jgi:hypothetical protein
MYLWRKDSGFFFQMRIPTAHAVNLGATPLRVWLGALKKREAQRRALGALGARDFASEETARGPSADPELVGHFRQAEARAMGRKQAMASVRSRLAAVGQALETDAAALTAERAAYAHALATVAATERPPCRPRLWRCRLPPIPLLRGSGATSAR